MVWQTKAQHEPFLTPFVKELQSLYTDGMDIQVDGRRKTLKSVLLSVVCDAPARCLTTSMTQFNGYFGCTTCEAPGKSVAVGKGHAHVYPYDISEQRFHDGHAILRTHSKTKQQGLDAVESGEAVQGVKGYSPLLELPKFNIIRGVTVDYMHCVLLGVVKSFISLWTNKSNRTCDWYIGNRLKDVDKRLLSIQPPKLISRAPHSLTDTSNWKASEYRSFLLYYALGCLYGILPDSYFNHFALLVQGIYLLLQKSVAKSDIKRAKNLLKQFCISIEEMYGARYETFNMHSLLHLADKTEDLGPLWCHSCFFYEDLNGDLRNLFHGTQQVHRQITLAVSVQQNIPKLVRAIPIGSPAAELYACLSKQHSRAEELESNKKVMPVGALTKCTVDKNISESIQAVLGKVFMFEKCERILTPGGFLLQSQMYKRVYKRNTYTVQFIDSDWNKSFGMVWFYLRCTLETDIVFVALVKKVKQAATSRVRNLTVPYFQEFSDMDKKVTIVRAENIVQPCVCVSSEELSLKYVAMFPNFIERD